MFRARFHLHERWSVPECAAELDRIRARGSHRVVLKAPDAPEVTDAIVRLEEAGIPVVTLVTDLPAAPRAAYVGIDNRAAGATAAYLLTQWLGDRAGPVAVTVSNDFFRGEEEREMGFRAAMRTMDPQRHIEYLPASDGLDETTRSLMAGALTAAEATSGGLAAVYSIGGGNAGIVRAFDDAGRQPAVFIGHDLYPDNVELLRRGRLDAVLHHDFRQGLRRCCQLILGTHGAVPAASPSPAASAIQVITPHNIPAGPQGQPATAVAPWQR